MAARDGVRLPAAVIAVAGAVAVAALSLLWADQPSYDGWAWLIWGREVASGTLDTVEGPAWKPGPVLLTAPFALLLGDAAPEAWLVVARAGALLAVVLAWRLAGPLAAAGVVLTAGVWFNALVGNAEGPFVAAALACLALRGRPQVAAGVVCALLRPESWPFLLAAVVWWRRWRLLWLVPAVLALWFLPELWGSGDLGRSSERARVPNPGQPATADVPWAASAELALGLLFVPIAAGAVLARGPARLWAAMGLAWIALVAVMAQLGYSGEGRYALPGAVVLTVAGAAGWRRCVPKWLHTGADGTHRVRWAAAGALAVACAVALPARVERHEHDLRTVADETRLWASLPAAIADAGGRDAVLRCGRPVTGRYRGTGLAYALRVPKRTVAFGAREGGVHFRSRIREHHAVQPPAHPGPVVGRSSRWELRYLPAPCESRPAQ